MEKLKVSYFRHFMRRQQSLEKTRMLRKIEGSRKRERPFATWTDSVKEAVSIRLQELSRAVEYRTWWTSLFIGLLGIS